VNFIERITLKSDRVDPYRISPIGLPIAEFEFNEFQSDVVSG